MLLGQALPVISVPSRSTTLQGAKLANTGGYGHTGARPMLHGVVLFNAQTKRLENICAETMRTESIFPFLNRG